jgi:transcriptional regulator with XRE-family HTH domain
VSLLARQTGFGQPHLSNYLHCRRQLSLEALDRILAAQSLTIDDLLPAERAREDANKETEGAAIPVVSHTVALFEPYIRPTAIQEMLHLPAHSLQSMRSRTSKTRRGWERFVAVRIPADDAPAMYPLVLPEALVLIDRHYTSTTAYRVGLPNLYAVRLGSRLLVRSVDFAMARLILRPLNADFPIELVEADPDDLPGDLITGRIGLIVNEP